MRVKSCLNRMAEAEARAAGPENYKMVCASGLTLDIFLPFLTAPFLTGTFLASSESLSDPGSSKSDPLSLLLLSCFLNCSFMLRERVLVTLIFLTAALSCTVSVGG